MRWFRKRVDALLTENAASARALPSVAEEVASTEAGKLLASLSGATDLAAVDAAIVQAAGTAMALEDLKAQELRLRAADTSRERQHLLRQAQKLKDVGEHIKQLNAALAAEVFESLPDNAARLTLLRRRPPTSPNGSLRSLFRASALCHGVRCGKPLGSSPKDTPFLAILFLWLARALIASSASSH